ATASMLSYVLFSCLLLSVQAHNCQVSEIIRFTTRLLDKNSVDCPCTEATASSCSCLPIPEAGHELSCFVEGTEHLMKNNMNSKEILQRLNRSFQTQLDRKFCGHLSHSNQCQAKTKGNVKQFLTEILKTYQAIKK
ncbi:IL9 protein, partial [Dromaius novaehollandiae]|nr:IL9 protein [Dromaius novaehollandiae]